MTGHEAQEWNGEAKVEAAAVIYGRKGSSLVVHAWRRSEDLLKSVCNPLENQVEELGPGFRRDFAFEGQGNIACDLCKKVLKGAWGPGKTADGKFVDAGECGTCRLAGSRDDGGRVMHHQVIEGVVTRTLKGRGGCKEFKVPAPAVKAPQVAAVAAKVSSEVSAPASKVEVPVVPESKVVKVMDKQDQNSAVPAKLVNITPKTAPASGVRCADCKSLIVMASRYAQTGNDGRTLCLLCKDKERDATKAAAAKAAAVVTPISYVTAPAAVEGPAKAPSKKTVPVPSVRPLPSAPVLLGEPDVDDFDGEGALPDEGLVETGAGEVAQGAEGGDPEPFELKSMKKEPIVVDADEVEAPKAAPKKIVEKPKAAVVAKPADSSPKTSVERANARRLRRGGDALHKACRKCGGQYKVTDGRLRAHKVEGERCVGSHDAPEGEPSILGQEKVVKERKVEPVVAAKEVVAKPKAPKKAKVAVAKPRAVKKAKAVVARPKTAKKAKVTKVRKVAKVTKVRKVTKPSTEAPKRVMQAIEEMARPPLMVLLAVTRRLQREGAEWIHTSAIVEEYKGLCVENDGLPRSYTQVWNYLDRMKAAGILTSRHGGPGSGTLSDMYSLLGFKAKDLEQRVTKILKDAQPVQATPPPAVASEAVSSPPVQELLKGASPKVLAVMAKELENVVLQAEYEVRGVSLVAYGTFAELVAVFSEFENSKAEFCIKSINIEEISSRGAQGA